MAGLAFNWYRIKLTIPERIGDFDPTGSTAVFDTSLDDYAEIWVDGELSRALGQSGGSVIAGWNAENHLVVGRNVKPGQQIQLAVFGINGPLSNPPTNFIYLRYAKLDFYKGTTGPLALTPSEVNVEVVATIRPWMKSSDRIRKSSNSPRVQVYRRSDLG